MTRLAIEINDSGLVVADSSEVLHEEPGYVFIDGDKVLTGRTAFECARLQPSKVSSRHWSTLTISADGQIDSSSAELAFQQLQGIWKQIGGKADSALLVVPSDYSTTQLGLVLGLAQECEIPVHAMVDSAVAAGDCAYPGAELVVVDAGLYGVTATWIEQQEDAIAGDSHSITHAGLANYYDAVVKAVAKLFVLETRFDPLHHAESEQYLYNKLHSWLKDLNAGRTVHASIEFEGNSLEVNFDIEKIRGACIGFYRDIFQLIALNRRSAAPLVVQVSYRLAQLPGLTAELVRLDYANVIETPTGHAGMTAIARIDRKNHRGDDIRLVRRLPFNNTASPQPSRSLLDRSAVDSIEGSSSVRPSHIVAAGIAHALDNGRLFCTFGEATNGNPRLTRQAAELSGRYIEIDASNGGCRLINRGMPGVVLNGQSVNSSALLDVGDSIAIDGANAQLLVIALAVGDGA